eukprot:4458636-Heterocapsa_arctica.AAC.1
MAKLKGKVKRGMGFWSPIGDSPLGNWLPKGHQSVTKSSLVMLIPLLALPFSFAQRIALLVRVLRRARRRRSGSLRG